MMAWAFFTALGALVLCASLAPREGLAQEKGKGKKVLMGCGLKINSPKSMATVTPSFDATGDIVTNSDMMGVVFSNDFSIFVEGTPTDTSPTDWTIKFADIPAATGLTLQVLADCGNDPDVDSVTIDVSGNLKTTDKKEEVAKIKLTIKSVVNQDGKKKINVDDTVVVTGTLENAPKSTRIFAVLIHPQKGGSVVVAGKSTRTDGTFETRINTKGKNLEAGGHYMLVFRAFSSEGTASDHKKGRIER